jgi:uncharacterized protein
MTIDELDESLTAPPQGSHSKSSPADTHKRRFGRIIAVDGSQATAAMEHFAPGDDAVTPSILQIGAVVKIPTSLSVLFAMIRKLSIPDPARDVTEGERKLVELELLGECPRLAEGGLAPFRRGVSNFPALGGGVFMATSEELALLYARPGVPTVRVGAIHQDRRLPATISVDDLLGKHYAIVGSTGSGKSCTVALILRTILTQNPSGHVLLLDPHNEYTRAFGSMAEVIGPSTLQLPYWLFNFEELGEVLKHTGMVMGPAEAALLSELITMAKRQFLGSGGDGRHITADTPSPYRMTLVVQQLEEAMGRLDKPDSLGPYQSLKNALNMLMSDARFDFMFTGGIAMRDNMVPILSRIFRVPVDGKPLTILDLSAVASEITNVVVSVLCRMAFDFAVWSDGEVPVLLVCEEAHRYVPENDRLGFEPTKRALSRIAKEGRKYGLSLCVITQRPSELAAGMLSQCSTIFAMRLTHEKDQQIVRSAMVDSAFGLLEALPSLGNAEAIAVGEGVAIPMRLVFDQLEPAQRPKSDTATFSTAWRKNVDDPEAFLQQVADRWRHQRR